MAEEITKDKEGIEKENSKSNNFFISVDEMAEAGLHFGHRTSKIHPKMKEYISCVKNGVHMIDLEKTKEKLILALDFIKKNISEEKSFILVGTKIQFKDLVKEIGEEAKIHYISGRWLGGTFTNFKTIKERIDYFKDLEAKKNKGELEKYTKKEKLEISRELENLENKFGGIKNMDKLPDLIFVLDMEKDGLAVKEAQKKGVKIIAIADTCVDPSVADFFIPANDDAISSVTYILNKVKETIVKARK